MRTVSTRRILPALAAGALVLAACGSDDADSADDAEPDTTEAAPEAEADTTEDDGEPDTTEAAAESDTTEDDAAEDDGEAMDDDAATEADGEATDDGAADDCAVENLPLFAEGQLTIATGEPVFPPWMLDDDPTSGEGFESAVAYALAEEMGFEADALEWVRTEFDVAIAPGDKDYDFNMQQYSPTPERDEVVDFSMPYYTAEKSVLALNSSPAAGATDFAGLQAASWGATTGTTDLSYLEDELGIDDVAVFDTQADVVAAMAAGQVDATVVGLPTAFFLSAVSLDDATIVGVLPPAEGSEDGDALALLFEEGSPLLSCVDQALASLDEAGTLDALAEEWLQGANDIPSITR